MRRIYNKKIEVALIIMPVTIVLSVLLLLEAFSNQHVLFSSLASSAFLIYLDPQHPTNSIRTLVIAQVSAALIGFLIFASIGTGYGPSALSMILTIFVMIFVKAMHPPAVSSALIFAFQPEPAQNLTLFLLAILLLVLLVALQQTSLWLIRISKKFSGSGQKGSPLSDEHQ